MPTLDPVFPWLAGLLGLLVGSFLNVVIHRLPRAMEAEDRDYCTALLGNTEPPVPPRLGRLQALITPGSHCPSCGTPLRAIDNIPVLSWLWLRGRCAHCGTRISARYPVVEALTAALSAVAAAHFGWGPAGAASLVLVWMLVAMSFIDADTTLLPDVLTLPLLWLGLLLNVHGTYAPLADAVIGASAGYLVLWTVYWCFRLATGREGMGYGDFKLLGALGAWMGWKMLLPIVLLSSLAGALLGSAYLLLARRGRDVPLPFGPYLAVAGYVALLFGGDILQRAGFA